MFCLFVSSSTFICVTLTIFLQHNDAMQFFILLDLEEVGHRRFTYFSFLYDARRNISNDIQSMQKFIPYFTSFLLLTKKTHIASNLKTSQKSVKSSSINGGNEPLSKGCTAILLDYLNTALHACSATLVALFCRHSAVRLGTLRMFEIINFPVHIIFLIP